MVKFTEGDDDDELGQAKKSPLKDPLNWIIIFGIIVIVLGWIGLLNLGSITYTKTLIFGIGLITMIIIAKLTIHLWQNKSPKIVWETGFSTHGKGHVEVGNWSMYRLGGVAAYGVYTKGTDGTIIAPITSKTVQGKSISLRIFATIVKKEVLPLEVQEVIEQEEMPAPYWWGLAAEEQFLSQLRDVDKISGLELPKVEYLIHEVKEKNRFITMLSELIKGKTGTVQEIMAAMSRIQSKAQRGNLKDELRRYNVLKRDDNE